MRRFLTAAFFALTLLTARPALAVVLDDHYLNSAAESATYDTSQTVEKIVGNTIAVLLGLLGVIFLVLTIYAGFLWMTAAGDEKKVARAKQILTTAVIGLVIIMAAYAISEFVVREVLTATDSTNY